MAINAVVDDVGFCADEPFEERLLRIVGDLIPFLMPLQFFGAFAPKASQIFICFCR